MAVLTHETSLRNSETQETLAVRTNVTQTNNLAFSGQADIALTETQVNFGTALTNPGLFVLINRDSDNYVDIGIAAGVYSLRLNPGESVQGRLTPSATTFYLIANTAPVRVQYTIYDA